MLIAFSFLVGIAGKSGVLSRLVSRFELFSATLTLIRGRISLENSTTGIFEDSRENERESEREMPVVVVSRGRQLDGKLKEKEGTKGGVR